MLQHLSVGRLFGRWPQGIVFTRQERGWPAYKRRSLSGIGNKGENGMPDNYACQFGPLIRGPDLAWPAKDSKGRALLFFLLF